MCLTGGCGFHKMYGLWCFKGGCLLWQQVPEVSGLSGGGLGKRYDILDQVLRKLGVLVLGLMILWGAGPVEAVTRRQVQIIQSKSVLSVKDLTMIDDFVQEQLDKMLMVEEESELDGIRSDLIASRTSKQLPAKAAFSERFAAAVKGHQKRIFAKAKDNYAKASENKDKKIARKVELSLAILVAKIDRASLIEDLVSLLGNGSAPVRYWAAKGLAMPTIRDHLLKSKRDSKEVESVVAGLSGALAKETHPMVIVQIARAAAIPSQEKARDVLMACVSKRQSQYQDWSVDKEFTDQMILNHLFKVVASESLANNAEAQTALIRSASGLLSVAYRRYQKVMQYKDEDGKVIVLYRKKRQRAMQALLIETEIKLRQACFRVDKTIRTKPRFQSALDSGKWPEIDKAYDYLLGEDGSVNRVFDLYPTGQPSLFVEIPDPPSKLVDQAIKRLFVEQNKIGEEK